MEKLTLTEEKYPAPILKDIRNTYSILAKYGANKIILYGSLARGNYRIDSDIDICVEGLPDKNYFRAIAECLMNIDRPVSVLDFKNVQGYFRERVLEEGKILVSGGRSACRASCIPPCGRGRYR